MNYAIIGEQISKFRKEKGLTQKELGDAIGVSSSAVSQWECGHTPDISLLPSLSEILGVTIDSLFGRNNIVYEDFEETVGKFIATQPEEKRISKLISIIQTSMLMGCAGEATNIVDFTSRDSEMIYIDHAAFVTDISSNTYSFLSAARCKDGALTDLMTCSDKLTGLFSFLAIPNAVTMLSMLYCEVPKHQTIKVLAKLSKIEQSDAERILQKFTELKLTEEFEVETENGNTKCYTLNLNGAALPLLLSAKLIIEQQSTIKIISDKRILNKGEF